VRLRPANPGDSPREANRRNNVAEANAAGPLAGAKPARGMARGLTWLTMRRPGQFRLGVKTDRGILDAPEAAKRLGVRAPGTIDDLLQVEDGPSRNAVVQAAPNPNVAPPFTSSKRKFSTDRW
jgi:hypothetical protein